MIIFVADKPSPKMDPDAPAFKGAACEKRLMSWVETVTTDKFHLINRVDPYFYMIARIHNHSGDKFVSLGNEASKALKLLNIPHFKLPHPSGRNRMINSPKLIAKKLKDCKAWLAK
jgi:hypothetical protein